MDAVGLCQIRWSITKRTRTDGPGSQKGQEVYGLNQIEGKKEKIMVLSLLSKFTDFMVLGCWVRLRYP